LALRQASLIPVTGLAEAAFVAAAARGRFAIVTGGVRWKPMLERLAHSLGFSAQLAGIHTVEATGAELAADPLGAQVVLARACNEAARTYAVQSVILGGAGLAGMAAQIQPVVTVPLVDSVLAGVSHALRQAQQEVLQPPTVFDFAWSHVSVELAATGV
jgi:Asp/Glu/hydantoin racemase